MDCYKLLFGRLAGEHAATTPRKDATIVTKEFKEDLVEKTPEKVEEKTNENVTYKDGDYEGVGKGHHGDIKVNVEVSGGKISNVKVVEQTETEAIYATAEEPVIKAIIEENSPNVEAVTGATNSSKGIMKAVENALEKAK